MMLKEDSGVHIRCTGIENVGRRQLEQLIMMSRKTEAYCSGV